MIGMIVTAPQICRVVVRDQQTLSMMPTVSEDIVIFFTFRCPLVLTQAVPFPMLVLDDTFSNERRLQDAIAGGFEEEAKVDIHQAIETKLLIDPAHFWQQFSSESHQITFNRIGISSACFLKLAQ